MIDRLEIIKTLDETAKLYGWSVRIEADPDTSKELILLYNRKGMAPVKIKLTKKRIQVRSYFYAKKEEYLRYSMPISNPENIAEYLESYCFAEKI